MGAETRSEAGGIDFIRVRGIEFHGYHGVSVAEQEVGHRFRVDLRLEADLRPAAHADDVNFTIDYAAAAREVLEVGTGPSVHLVETLAERMAARLLGRFPTLLTVEVEVTKLQPPAPIPFQSCSVVLRRCR